MQLRLPRARLSRARLRAPSADTAINTAVAALALTACVAIYATWRFSKLMP